MTKRTPAKKQSESESATMESNSASDNVNALIHLRGITQGKVTRIKNTLQLAEVQGDELTLPIVKVYKKKLDAAYSEFNDVHQRIVTNVPQAKREEQDEKYLQFDDLHDEVSVLIETWLERFIPNERQQAVGAQPFVIQQSLPRAIPTFDGRYECWEKFKVMFRDVVDKSSESARIKLYHLEKSLIGEASGIIDAKTISEGNYDHAWQILEERYEDKRRMIELHIGELLRTKKISKESPIELRSMVDSFVNHIENLKFLGQEFTGVSQQIITHLIAHTLDDETHKLWESTIKRGELPTYEHTIEFLKDRISILERCQESTQPQKLNVVPKAYPKKQYQKVNLAAAPNQQSYKCDICGNNHLIFKCPSFIQLSPGQRLAKIKEMNLCYNCLRRGHRILECPSKKSCFKCHRKHHTLLHLNELTHAPSNPGSEINVENAIPGPSRNQANDGQPANVTSAHSHFPVKPSSHVFLLTAVVDVLDQQNRSHPCRALLDSGSQINFISQSLATELGVQVEEVNISINGIGSIKSRINQRCTVVVRSKYNEISFALDCMVASKITDRIPSVDIPVDINAIPYGVQLADPEFYKSSDIDMLIGMEWFYDLIKPGYLKLSDELPILHDSQLGWLVGGKCVENSDFRSISHEHHAHVVMDSLSELMQKFWKVEAITPEAQVTTDEEDCENHFTVTHRRDSYGRFIVQLPLKDTFSQLPNSRWLALRRFYMLEHKLNQKPDLRMQYNAFIEEYETLGHCREINECDDPPNIKTWYLPHHAVLRPSNSTTQCRVVFDASAKVGGISLNDVMTVGPTVQSDLLSIILRFRITRYVLSADITKMYRQIFVDLCHTPLQRIFWRNSPNQRLRILELNTVTYGTASAPFLATRALLQLARDGQDRYPLAAKVIERNFYVDNALFGANNIDEAKETQAQLIALLNTAGMHLHKWSSNNKNLLDIIPCQDRDSLVCVGESAANEIIKTLGLMWNPFTDEFLFIPDPPINCDKPTKRQVLSTIAKIFDPLGLISPVVIIAKVLMQRLWKSNLQWDDVLDETLSAQWKKFIASLPYIERIRIPRHVISLEAEVIELHGFADASNVAYGACIYIRSVKRDGTSTLKLISSKSKVAPIDPVTIPRKELLAAQLLTRLIKKVKGEMGIHFQSINLWSDSQVVLAWLRKPLNNLQVFVRNRVAEIISEDYAEWRYVKSIENPADIISRGQSASELSQNDIWWNGPLFLRKNNHLIEIPDELPDSDIPELRADASVHHAMSYEDFPILQKYNSFRKTQRIIAFMLRFISNCQKPREQRIFNPFPTIVELRESMKTIVGAVQYQEFSKEIECIKTNNSNHRLHNLHPFIDNNLVRVGGRIRHAQLPFETKHQLILPDKNLLIRRLISAVHQENMHVGVSAVISILRQQFWLLNAKSTVRKVIRGCITCFKSAPSTIGQQMGDLPHYRLAVAPAFQNVGIDYAGPIFLKQAPRKSTPVKGYICIFVCMVTKALHLEAVENLSTESFLAALQRFASRRGIPENIFSDNGTNFIGAKNELHELYRLFQQELTQKGIFEFCQAKEINWKTIPPNSPHFGGLWEAGVKSVKSILKKVYKSASFTIFEFSTLLCQIEAILNSRPLYAHSNDPRDPEALTPGHLMANRPLIAIPEPTYADLPSNRLSRWQHIQQLREHFWKRWSKEYITELQVRGKWTSKKTNIQPGSIVLIKDDNLPPQNWKLGRIEKVYPGADNLVRVVDVSTRTGILRRPIHKLAPLPILDNDPAI